VFVIVLKPSKVPKVTLWVMPLSLLASDLITGAVRAGLPLVPVSFGETLMNRNALNILALLACCGAAVPALAQPSVINISGATLLENYIRFPAATNDFIDVDLDGISGIAGTGVDQLAPATTGGVYSPDLRWIIQYRVVGSVNGIKELFLFGSPNAATGNDANPNATGGILGARPNSMPAITGDASVAYVNRATYITGGGFTGVYNAGNPGGAPYRSDLSANALASWIAAPASAPGSVRIDIAPTDVPVFWGVQKAGTPQAFDKPADAGYGANARRSVNRNGGTTGFGNLPNDLAQLGSRNLYDGVPANANANTIFDNPLSYAVICPIVSLGTGITQVTSTELRHMFATGRTITGENLQVITRDIGSGTRNAFYNCIGLDPSFGVGDNIGGLSVLTVNNNIGSQWSPTNKSSNGNMEATLRNARLGIGYAGGERGVTGGGSGSWLTNLALEIPSVRNDIYVGGTNFVRPTTTNIVFSGGNGWVIGGPAVLATVGDPLAEPVAVGGQGLATPGMTNKAAAAFLNNTTRSIAAFVASPANVANVGMPGEYAATQFTLNAAFTLIQSPFDAVLLIANPGFNAAVQSAALGGSIYNTPRFNAPDFTHAGRVPTRTNGTVYSDGVANGANYISQAGAVVTYGAALSLRNKIAADFDGNGVRNIGDTVEMMRALRSRGGGPVWNAPMGTGPITGQPGSDAVIEILGDFDGNGSFELADVRYFADGLAVAPSGRVDRKAGFIAVDNAALAAGLPLNVFSTVLITGAPYTAGASRADVIGSSGNVARGWAPVGADGIVDARDICYIFAQFAQNPTAIAGEVSWNNLSQAITFDLSADLTGDLKVNIDDITEVLTILGTSMGDVNLDGAVNQLDLNIINANLNTSGCWSSGDVNGDGLINLTDFNIVNAIVNPAPVCLADIVGGDGNPPGGDGVDGNDFQAFLNAFGAGSSLADLVGGDGNPPGGDGADGNDFQAFLNAFGAGC